MANYSPLGDKLIVSTNNSIIMIDSYTFQVYKIVNLPNIFNYGVNNDQQVPKNKSIIQM